MLGEKIEMVNPISKQELTDLIRLLNKALIHSRQRTLSFESRFSGVYDTDNLDKLFVAKADSRIISSVAVKHRQLIYNGTTLDLAMLGGVFTKPNYRGQGLASSILRYVETSLRQTEFDATVLWTTIPSFYERVGWNLWDIGLYGPLQKRKLLKASQTTVKCVSITTEAIKRLEEIRAKYLPCRVIRQPIDYQTIPFPAEKIECFKVVVDDEWKAYAISGRSNDIGYVYEIIGDPAVFIDLLSAIGGAYQKIYVNDYIGSPSAQWMDAHKLACLAPKNLAMWQILTSSLTMENMKPIYISFMDRI